MTIMRALAAATIFSRSKAPPPLVPQTNGDARFTGPAWQAFPYNAMAQAHEAWIVEAFSGLSPRDIEAMYSLLAKVKQHFYETA